MNFLHWMSTCIRYPLWPLFIVLCLCDGLNFSITTKTRLFADHEIDVNRKTRRSYCNPCPHRVLYVLPTPFKTSLYFHYLRLDFFQYFKSGVKTRPLRLVSTLWVSTSSDLTRGNPYLTSLPTVPFINYRLTEFSRERDNKTVGYGHGHSLNWTCL